MALKGLLLDLDATLLDYSDQAYALTVRNVCAELCEIDPALDFEGLKASYTKINGEYWQSVGNGLIRAPSGSTAGIEIWQELWASALESCGSGAAQHSARALERYIFHRHEAYRMFSDVEVMLGEVQDRLSLAVVTNGPSDTQRDKLRFLGLEERFSVVAISGELGVAKPNREIFQFVLDQLGIRADEACHVGDSLLSDVAGAREIGMTAVWLNRLGIIRRGNDPAPHFEITTLRELPSILGIV